MEDMRVQILRDKLEEAEKRIAELETEIIETKKSGSILDSAIRELRASDIAIEREACAKIADDWAKYYHVVRKISDAIRARGKESK